jgi:hypothetical protein
MTARAKGKTYVAYLITWTESERGWGYRPDGASLHLTQDDAKKYLKAYWDRMPTEVPHEYSRNDSDTGTLVAISPTMYKELKNSKNHSTRLWQGELREARTKRHIKE